MLSSILSFEKLINLLRRDLSLTLRVVIFVLDQEPKDLNTMDPLIGPEEASSANDSDYEKGKVAELRQELTMGGKKDKNNSVKKIALKKIVANMTMSNNDMVALFPDIVQCMHIPSLEIKKMYAMIPIPYTTFGFKLT